MAEIDLDALRVARAEARAGSDPKTLRLGGKSYLLPDELPVTFGERLVAGEFTAALADLLAAEAARDFFANGLSVEDVRAIAEAIPGLYRILPDDEGEDGLGKSPASPRSLPSIGTRSRPTSKRSTA